MNNYRLRLNLIFGCFVRNRTADGYLNFQTPVETGTSPKSLFVPVAQNISYSTVILQYYRHKYNQILVNDRYSNIVIDF